MTYRTSRRILGTAHEILSSHLTAGFSLNALNSGPSWPHGAAAPFRYGDGVNTHARCKLRAGYFSGCEKGA